MSNPQKIIAVIDDDPEMRASLAMLLKSYGYGVETFDSASTFLTFAAKCPATCLLVDIQLGDITGVELARQLMADGYKFAVIFMTAHHDVATERKAAAAGGIAFLRKPFPATTLMDAIKKANG
jgi:FixJ family two-component response regulator